MEIFVMMPFREEYEDVYDNIKLASEEAAPKEGVQCRNLDEIKGAGKITDDLLLQITSASLCIADVTGNNPNVLWEVGYAIALNKPTIIITQDTKTLPFDLKDMRAVEYDRSKLRTTLREPLTESIRKTLARYEVRRESRTIRMPGKVAFTIAVTGSMRAEPARCARRVQTLVYPYLRENTTWYLGSFGVVDETVAQYLGDNKQKVIVVGYHLYDISERMLQIMETYNFPFVDAQKEQIPRGMNAPSERDLLFATKSDLMILIWNGESTGTKELIEWCRLHGKDHIVGFI
jgi:nucleoside 2-deoxyribosyltransferase